jgi:hypothetical protein
LGQEVGSDNGIAARAAVTAADVISLGIVALLEVVF